MKYTKDTTPVLRGRMGNAWLIDTEAIARQHGNLDDPRKSVTLPCWIASAAYAHPVWSHYAVMCVALRDIPGVPKAVVNLPGATHEIMVAALDPDVPTAVDTMPRALHPMNFAGQFVAADDAEASARVQQAVQDMIDGVLNPDTDFRSQWVARFSGSNLKMGALDPDFIAVKDGDLIMSGTGASNTRVMQEIATTIATLKADESKPQ